MVDPHRVCAVRGHCIIPIKRQRWKGLPAISAEASSSRGLGIIDFALSFFNLPNERLGLLMGQALFGLLLKPAPGAEIGSWRAVLPTRDQSWLRRPRLQLVFDPKHHGAQRSQPP